MVVLDHLLLLFFISAVTAFVFLLCSLSLLPPDTTRASSAEGRAESEVDMLLGIQTDDEGRNVDNLFANTTRVRH